MNAPDQCYESMCDEDSFAASSMKTIEELSLRSRRKPYRSKTRKKKIRARRTRLRRRK